jgi:hypothetical protein
MISGDVPNDGLYVRKSELGAGNIKYQYPNTKWWIRILIFDILADILRYEAEYAR